MFAPANQPRFTLTIDGVQNELKVLEFTGTEAISQPYRFDLELVSERPDIELESLLHRQAFLSFDAQGSGIHGQILRVGQSDSGQRLTGYQISLVPRLSYLGQRINQRIFQHKNVPAIITQVLKDHGIQRDAFEFRLGSDYPEREYCVQYAESDLAFIQRLCAEIGIHYHFQHSIDGHLLVFGDDQTVFPRLPEPTLYLPGSGMAADAPAIKRFNVRLETRTTAVTRCDYDFKNLACNLKAASTVSCDRCSRITTFLANSPTANTASIWPNEHSNATTPTSVRPKVVATNRRWSAGISCTWPSIRVRHGMTCG